MGHAVDRDPDPPASGIGRGSAIHPVRVPVVPDNTSASKAPLDAGAAVGVVTTVDGAAPVVAVVLALGDAGAGDGIEEVDGAGVVGTGVPVVTGTESVVGAALEAVVSGTDGLSGGDVGVAASARVSISLPSGGAAAGPTVEQLTWVTLLVAMPIAQTQISLFRPRSSGTDTWNPWMPGTPYWASSGRGWFAVNTFRTPLTLTCTWIDCP